MTTHTLSDHTTKQTAIAPIKADQPLAELFPLGIPIIFPEGDEAEPTLLVDDEEYYEIPWQEMGDSSLLKIVELYSSDRVSPLLAGQFAILRRALVPARWIGAAS